MRFLIQALGWMLIVLAVASVAAQVDSAHAGKNTDVAVSIMLIVLCGGGGTLLVRAGRRMSRAARSGAPAGPTVEQRVLAAARVHHGRVTAVSVAADGNVTLEQARTELERLAKENACLMDVSPDGRVVFRFPEFETSEATLSS
jgi:hypothetical protein